MLKIKLVFYERTLYNLAANLSQTSRNKACTLEAWEHLHQPRRGCNPKKTLQIKLPSFGTAFGPLVEPLNDCRIYLEQNETCKP